MADRNTRNYKRSETILAEIRVVLTLTSELLARNYNKKNIMILSRFNLQLVNSGRLMPLGNKTAKDEVELEYLDHRNIDFINTISSSGVCNKLARNRRSEP